MRGRRKLPVPTRSCVAGAIIIFVSGRISIVDLLSSTVILGKLVYLQFDVRHAWGGTELSTRVYRSWCVLKCKSPRRLDVPPRCAFEKTRTSKTRKTLSATSIPELPRKTEVHRCECERITGALERKRRRKTLGEGSGYPFVKTRATA